jgi:hypothetical protein
MTHTQPLAADAIRTTLPYVHTYGAEYGPDTRPYVCTTPRCQDAHAFPWTQRATVDADATDASTTGRL